MKRYILYTLMLLIAQQICVGQERLVGKVVTAHDQQPLAGASVKVNETGRSWTTDSAGIFSIIVNESQTLTVSFIGFKPKLIKRSDFNKQTLIIYMEPETGSLQEVVVSTGYQNVPKERSTGSFVAVGREQLNRRVSTDIISRLEDLVPGLVFTRKAASSINIRGQGTIYGNAQPLIVLDNFPYEGDLNNINPNDIESVTVLKDAAAASIWGARAGNGVIVLTSKKGAYSSKARVSFNSNITLGDTPDLFYQSKMTTAEFIEMEKYLFGKNFYRTAELSANKTPLTPVVELLIAKRDGKIPGTEADAQVEALKQLDVRHDFEKYLYRQSLNSQSSVNINGGADQHAYNISAGYDRNLENLVRNNYSRITLNASNTFKAFGSKLEFRTGIAYNNSRSAQNNQGINAIVMAAGNPVYPYARLADKEGQPMSVIRNYRSTYLNSLAANQAGLLSWQYRPLEEIEAADNTGRNNEYRINAGLTFKPIAGLQAEVLYQHSRSMFDSRNLQSVQSYNTRDQINLLTSVDAAGNLIRPVPVGDILDRGITQSGSHNIRGQVNYVVSWKQKHQLSAIAGSELRDVNSRGEVYRLYGYDDDLGLAKVVDYQNAYRWLINPARTTTIPNMDRQTGTTDRYLSYYTNAAYTLRSRYTISGSARLDRSNLFGVNANQKGIPLWSVGLGYTLSDEKFYKVSALPYLKLRLTYGYNGNVNRNISAYTTAQYFNQAYLTLLPYSAINNPPNPELRWERIRMVNLGADFESRNRRLVGTIEYYHKNGIDLIGDTPYPPSTGITSFRGNTASIKGKGLDVSLTTRNIDNVFKWSTSLIYSYATDKVTDYKHEAPSYNYIQSAEGIPLEGRPLYSLYSYRWAGLDPQTGSARGYLNGEVSSNGAAIVFGTSLDDMVFSGSARPVHFGAVRNSFTWKALSVSANISYRLGYYFRKSSVNYNAVLSGRLSHGDFARRWQKPGDEQLTNVPALPAVRNIDQDALYLYSEALVEKGDHIRLQDVSLSYDLLRNNALKLPFKGLQLYLYANNLGLLWKANDAGLDPDYQNMKPVQTLAGGLKANF